MSRRAALPGANELFRTTSSTLEAAAEPAPGDVEAADVAGGEGSDRAGGSGSGGSEPTKPRLRRVRSSTLEPSGRERHDEKITVYVSSDELMALEDARVALYRDHGVKIDRGRIVREAIALVMSDLQTKGTSSILVRRLTDR